MISPKTFGGLVFRMYRLIHGRSQRQRSVRTYEVFAKDVLSNVLEQGGEDRQQGEGGVVDDLSDASGLLPAVSELAQLQVFLRLLQILGGAVEVGPQRCLHRLQAGLHHCPEM